MRKVLSAALAALFALSLVGAATACPYKDSEKQSEAQEDAKSS